MTVVAAWRYRDGARERAVALDEGPPPEGDVGVFDWIGLHDPAPDELSGSSGPTGSTRSPSRTR